MEEAARIMRGMLMRAAEIRDSEQQQIFDSNSYMLAAAAKAAGAERYAADELKAAREAMTNAARHGEATDIRISLDLASVTGENDAGLRNVSGSVVITADEGLRKHYRIDTVVRHRAV